MIWNWIENNAIIPNVVIFWVGSLPVAAGVSAGVLKVWHKVTERRHREHLLALTAPHLVRPALLAGRPIVVDQAKEQS